MRVFKIQFIIRRFKIQIIKVLERVHILLTWWIFLSFARWRGWWFNLIMLSACGVSGVKCAILRIGIFKIQVLLRIFKIQGIKVLERVHILLIN